MTRPLAYPLAALVSAALWAVLSTAAWGGGCNGIGECWLSDADLATPTSTTTPSPTASVTPTSLPHECGKGPVTIRVEGEAPCVERVSGDAYRIEREIWPPPGTIGRIRPCTRTVLRPERWTDWPECGGEPVAEPTRCPPKPERLEIEPCNGWARRGRP